MANTEQLDCGDAELAKVNTNWRNRILRTARNAVEHHYINRPTSDFTDEEIGFERGLQTAIIEISRFIVREETTNANH